MTLSEQQLKAIMSRVAIKEPGRNPWQLPWRVSAVIKHRLELTTPTPFFVIVTAVFIMALLQGCATGRGPKAVMEAPKAAVEDYASIMAQPQASYYPKEVAEAPSVSLPEASPPEERKISAYAAAPEHEFAKEQSNRTRPIRLGRYANIDRLRGGVTARLHPSTIPATDKVAVAAASSELSADNERMRKRDEYLKGLQKGNYSFNPPTPIKVAQPITVALWVDPVAEAAQLAEEMKKAFPESAALVETGETTWSPTMRATLTGVDFEITPIEGKDFNGTKGLSLTGRTEWGWTIVPTSPGKKKLHLVLWVVLPPELGEPRELPQIHREVEVEVTFWWLIDHYWEKYWKWIISGLVSALATAIGWWWKTRRGGVGK